MAADRSAGRRRLVVAAAWCSPSAAGAAWTLWRADQAFQGAILVADFEDNAGDPVLAEAVREGLTVKLQQSRSLNVLSREQVVGALQRMERSAGAKTLDHQTAVELCQREGIQLLLAGSLHKRGGADMGDGQWNRPGQPRRPVHAPRLSSGTRAMFSGARRARSARAAAARRVCDRYRAEQPTAGGSHDCLGRGAEAVLRARGRITSAATRTRPSRSSARRFESIRVSPWPTG